ncbi:MFS general substrate transporter [Dentipellis sp. KUC8613]|nr:MFS general substrate transporter [Dentipellis sp. KUC8613]
MSPSSLLHKARLGVTCCSVAANALCAGGIFTFPLLSPSLALHLKLTQPQLTTIVLAGMIGQYPFAAVVGKIIDSHGPWACSMISSVLFSFGFGSFAWEIAKTPDDISQPSQSSFHRLTFFFFLAGLGTVFSYFSSLFAASKNFPNYIGVASGSSMALFGLSPLFLSFLAKLFTDPTSGLDVTRFLTFLAILAGVVHVIGALVLQVPSQTSDKAPFSADDSEQEDIEHSAEQDERQPLLPGKQPQVSVDVVLVEIEEDPTVLGLVKDPYFWVLALITMLTLGSCEMVISNIGTIVLSLPSSAQRGISVLTSSADAATSTQVRVLSVANTVSRLIAGPLADFTSPVASYLPSGVRSFPRKHFASRVVFLTGATFFLAIAFLSLELGIRTQEGLWVLSTATGIAYGVTFTILPSIVSSVWGSTNLGRNFGVLTYAPFLGTPFFSYLYAFVSASNNTGDEGVCVGVSCWRLTFWISAGAAVVACGASTILWRQWKGRV